MAATDKTTPKDGKKLKQTAQNDMRCDASRYPNRSDLPKDCLEKSGTGAAATNSTQKQSGGDGAGSPGSSAGSSSSGSAGSSGGASK
ncbi:MAG TPA: hypothetical protein VM073_07450 [Usitatibacter sp.]|nr:hypothetical protein [Usitatibacter sp.]